MFWLYPLGGGLLWFAYVTCRIAIHDDEALVGVVLEILLIIVPCLVKVT